MKLTRYAVTGLLLFLCACEIPPDAPDFKLEHKVQAPISQNLRYQFLGSGSGALIDTTNDDFDSLFTVGGDGLISLSRQENFDFGALNDAIPQVNVDPIAINSQVGEIQLTEFNSSGNVGSADFTTVTGFGGGLSQGDSIPGGSTPGTITINFSTDYFVSATVKSGGVDIQFTNNLGFDIDQLDLTLNSSAEAGAVASQTFFNVNDADVVVWEITFSAGTQLADLSIDVDASWSAQNLSSDPQSLDVNSVTGDNLVASQVTAVVPGQDFTSSGTSSVDNAEFLFNQPDHHVELRSGQLRIFNVTNQIDVDITNLQISFPDIRTAPYNPEDSLVVSLQVPEGTSGLEDITDLSDVRIYAESNTIDYNILGATRDYQSNGDGTSQTINENNEVSASVEINNLEVRSAFGVVLPQRVLLNEDDAGNGLNVLDLYNDNEAETVDISEIEDLSKQIDGLEFVEPLLGILYNTNIGVDAVIYAAILGVNANGNEVFLNGTAPETQVSSGEIPPELSVNGSTLNSSELIKFTLSTSPDGSEVTGSTDFDVSNSNVDEFLNNLPTQIRFVGVSELNENSQEGIIRDPVLFEPSLSVDLPLYFSTQTSSYSDTLDADLSDLPKEGDKQRLKEGTLTIGYTNALPFRFTLRLRMLDGNNQQLTEIPLAGQQELVLGGGQVNSTSRFVDTPREGRLMFSLTEEQLQVLNRSRSVVLDIDFNTTAQEEVKVRAEDSVTLSVKMNVTIETSVN